MSLLDLLFKPFENMIRPVDMPVSSLPSKSPYGLLMHFVSMFRGVLLSVAALSMALEVINLIVVWSLAYTIDIIDEQGVDAVIKELWQVPLIVAILLFPIMPVISFLSNALSALTVASCMPVAILWQGHKAIERQDISFFHDRVAGQIASRLSQVSNAVQQQIVVAFQSVPYFLIQLCGSVFLLGAIAWQLAIPVFAWGLANVALVAIAIPHFTERARQTAGQRSHVFGAMTDLYGNMQTVKQFSAESFEATNIKTSLSELVAVQQRERRVYIATDTSVTILNSLLWLSVFAVGFWGMRSGVVSIGSFAAAAYLAQRLSGNSRAFFQIGYQIFQAIGTLRDAMPIMTTEPLIKDEQSAQEVNITRGDIVYSNIKFGYRGGRTVLNKICIKIDAGEKVGLVGRSGAGKTTLVNLLLRFYEIEQGAICVDGFDIRSITQASLRAGIGVISQDVSLLHRSIMENIGYGCARAGHEAVRQAAQVARAEAFIVNLRDNEGRTGYEAHVGDRGVKLSGGQRQRIAIARAVLKDAPILVLDEATSALDSESEFAIQHSLVSVMRGKTVIAIAHRLSTIANMDRIIVLDDGRIAEVGAPDELRARGGIYSRLWEQQTNGFIASGDVR